MAFSLAQLKSIRLKRLNEICRARTVGEDVCLSLIRSASQPFFKKQFWDLCRFLHNLQNSLQPTESLWFPQASTQVQHLIQDRNLNNLEYNSAVYQTKKLLEGYAKRTLLCLFVYTPPTVAPYVGFLYFFEQHESNWLSSRCR